MIITEYCETRPDGVRLVRTYSDSGFLIQQNGTGAMYTEAIDPEDSGRTYIEVEIPVGDDLNPEEALSIITGGIT